MKYTTEPRKKLLLFLEENKNKDFTVEELGEVMNDISISTIYRNINKMALGGYVRSFRKTGCKKTYYQYLAENECRNHMHLKCSRCGNIFHIDNHCMNDFFEIIKNNYDFHIDKSETVLYGFCDVCKAGNE